MLVGETNAKIIIKSSALGDTKYPVLLKGTSLPNPVSLAPIECGLGFEKIFHFNFTSYLLKPTVYTVKLEKFNQSLPNPIDFIPEQTTIQVPGSVNIEKGVEVVGSVKYEPYFIGESKAILSVSSQEGGHYQFFLVGKSYAPPSQGPFKIPSGKSYNLEFRNPLDGAAEISVISFNPAFVVNKAATKIEAKKTIQIPIVYKPTGDSENTGTLQVTLNKMPPWIFYLLAE